MNRPTFGSLKPLLLVVGISFVAATGFCAPGDITWSGPTAISTGANAGSLDVQTANLTQIAGWDFDTTGNTVNGVTFVTTPVGGLEASPRAGCDAPPQNKQIDLPNNPHYGARGRAPSKAILEYHSPDQP